MLRPILWGIMEQQQPTLKQRLLAKAISLGRAPATGEAYWKWAEKFLRFHRTPKGEWVHPSNLGRDEIEQYLTFLAAKMRVSPSTQNQAFSAILFMYKQVLGIEITGVNALRAFQPKYVPEVLNEREIIALLEQLSGRNRLIA